MLGGVLQGGALVDVGELRGFVPLSKMDPARLPRNAQGAPGGNGNGPAPRDLAHLIGKPIAAKVIQARRPGGVRRCRGAQGALWCSPLL